MNKEMSITEQLFLSIAAQRPDGVVQVNRYGRYRTAASYLQRRGYFTKLKDEPVAEFKITPAGRKAYKNAPKADNGLHVRSRAAGIKSTAITRPLRSDEEVRERRERLRTRKQARLLRKILGGLS